MMTVRVDSIGNDHYIVRTLSRNSTKLEYSGSLRGFIMWLFNGRCVTCRRFATDVNHIIPKSRLGDSHSWKNQVAQCSECHSAYHHNGVTDDKIKELQEARKNFLIALGRERFV